MTYTAHASIVSGTYPEKHGVITNEVFTPLMNKAPWYELRTQNKAQILPELAQENGYSAFINSWPTLVGANVDYVIQRAGIHYPKEEQESEIRKKLKCCFNTRNVGLLCRSMDITKLLFNR